MLLLSLGAALLAVTIVLRRLAEIERRHKEEREKESETAGDEFTSAGILAAELCHAIASPLTVILGQCELARTRNEEDRRLRMIAEGARSITDSIDRYRSLVQPGSGACHPIDPEQCAEAAIHALKPLAKRRDVNVHMLVDCAPTIESNAFLLSHGVRQMLQVAIEASPQRRGDVTLGPGAVGYSIVETIARSIGGALVLDSAPGHGTRATLKVPLLPSAATRAARRPAQLARTRG
jgi:signal transduction histidine kinase